MLYCEWRGKKIEQVISMGRFREKKINVKDIYNDDQKTILKVQYHMQVKNTIGHRISEHFVKYINHS